MKGKRGERERDEGYEGREGGRGRVRGGEMGRKGQQEKRDGKERKRDRVKRVGWRERETLVSPVAVRRGVEGVVKQQGGHSVAWKGNRDGRDDIPSLKQVGMIAHLKHTE